jgi:hypothetical protein
MVIVDCIELKKKLFWQLKSLRKFLFETIEDKIKTKNNALIIKMNGYIKLLSKSINSTS